MCTRTSSPMGMRKGGPSDVMTEEEFAGNLGVSKGFNTGSGDGSQASMEADDAARQTGNKDIDNVMTRIQSVFGQDDDAADRYRSFMDNYRTSAGMKTGRGLRSFFSLGPVSTAINALAGTKFGPDSAANIADRQMSDIFDYAEKVPGSVKTTDDGLGLTITTPNGGTINFSKSGFTTYSGVADPDYDGPFANLVKPPKLEGGSDDVTTNKTPLDPCPAGFKYNEDTLSCERIEDTVDDSTMGTNFVRNTEPMPALSSYGSTGTGEYRFFTEMPGIIGAKDGIPRGPTGEIRGAGGPKDDLVGPFMLSSQEYVEPYERVLDEGDGNYNRGIRVLEKKRLAALRKYRDRVKSEERNRA